MSTFTQPGDDEHLLDAALNLDDIDVITQHGALLERAEAFACTHGKGEQVTGRIHLLQARRYAQLCDYERGYRCGLEASGMLERSGDTARAIGAIDICSVICLETGDTAGALEHSQRALAKARATGDVLAQMRLLNNRAMMFFAAEENAAALRCIEEAVHIGAGVEQGRTSHERAGSLRALAHLRIAQTLTQRGCTAEAQARRQEAAAMLPAVTAESPLGVLQDVLEARTRLGDVAAARAVAVMFIRRVRHSGRSPRLLSHAWFALGALHSLAGRPDKGACRMERAVGKMRAIGRIDELITAERQLAAACAATGRHDKALHWIRQAHADHARLQPAQARLRCRIAALERDAQDRALEHQTTLLHTQRLAVVGRMMAQIYHALKTPIAAVRLTIGQCLDGADEAAQVGLVDALHSVVAHIEEATALARQLKMFSYRAAPQATTLDLSAELHGAWQGVAIGYAGPVPSLTLEGERQPLVRVDAQRLAVLLRILLIEAERFSRPASPRVVLALRGAAVRVELLCGGLGSAAEHATSVGFMLCEEIAREMQGSLARSNGPGGEMRLALELPAEH